jgi:hypothetical protein
VSRWHPREHRKALDGMLMLTLEERGAYNTCLDLIYDREGPIPDDARWLAGWMGVSVRKWASIRSALIVKAKLFEVSLNGIPSLMGDRSCEEIALLRRVLLQRLAPADWAVVRARILRRDGEVCAYCATTNGPFEIDHIHPISRGGSNWDGNLCVACLPCNRSKSDKTVAEWRASA